MTVYEAMSKVLEAKSNLIDELMILMPKSPTDEDYQKVAELQEAVTAANTELIATINASKSGASTPSEIPPQKTAVSDKDNELVMAMYACMQAKDKVINYMSANAMLTLASCQMFQQLLGEEHAVCMKYNEIVMKKKGGGNG